MKTAQLLLIASGAVLAGCTNLNAPMSVNEDLATMQNFAAQVEDPTPVEGAPSMSASMSDAAIARYEAGETADQGESETASFTFSATPAE